MPIDRTTVNRVTAILPPAFLEPVTLSVRTLDVGGVATDGYESNPVAKARRMDSGWVARNMIADGVVLPANAVVWEVYSNYLPVRKGAVVAPGKDDYLVDSRGVSWVVVEVLGDLNGTVLRLVTTKGR